MHYCRRRRESPKGNTRLGLCWGVEGAGAAYPIPAACAAAAAAAAAAAPFCAAAGGATGMPADTSLHARAYVA